MPRLSPDRLRAVSYDLFETLVTIEPERLPGLEVAGRRLPSTVPVLIDALRPNLPDLDSGRFVAEMMIAFRDAREALPDPLLELPPRRAFERLLRRLGVPPAEIGERAAELELAHGRTLADAVVALPGAQAAVDRVRALGFQTALASNLDFGPMAPWVLDRVGLTECFDAVVLSFDIGYRKPHEAVFRAVLDRLGLEPSAVLHVGDQPIADVEGAAAAGLRTAWVRTAGCDYPRDQRAPDLTLERAADLPERLAIGRDGPDT